MRNLRSISILTLLLLLVIGELKATTCLNPTIESEIQSVYDLSAQDLMTLSKSSLEAKLNRKLTLQERATLPFVKRKIKKIIESAEKEGKETIEIDILGLTGFTLSLVGLLFWLLSPAAIILCVVALRRIKSDPNGRAGRGLSLLGIVFGILGSIFLYISIYVFIDAMIKIYS